MNTLITIKKLIFFSLSMAFALPSLGQSRARVCGDLFFDARHAIESSQETILSTADQLLHARQSALFSERIQASEAFFADTKPPREAAPFPGETLWALFKQLDQVNQKWNQNHMNGGGHLSALHQERVALEDRIRAVVKADEKYFNPPYHKPVINTDSVDDLMTALRNSDRHPESIDVPSGFVRLMLDASPILFGHEVSLEVRTEARRILLLHRQELMLRILERQIGGLVANIVYELKHPIDMADLQSHYLRIQQKQNTGETLLVWETEVLLLSDRLQAIDLASQAKSSGLWINLAQDVQREYPSVRPILLNIPIRVSPLNNAIGTDVHASNEHSGFIADPTNVPIPFPLQAEDDDLN